MSNFTRSVLYIGVTGNLEKRVREHRNHIRAGFTLRYHCIYLLYYEDYQDVHNAIAREKQLKNWKREWKMELITKMNPSLEDLAKNW